MSVPPSNKSVPPALSIATVAVDPKVTTNADGATEAVITARTRTTQGEQIFSRLDQELGVVIPSQEYRAQLAPQGWQLPPALKSLDAYRTYLCGTDRNACLPNGLEQRVAQFLMQSGTVDRDSDPVHDPQLLQPALRQQLHSSIQINWSAVRNTMHAVLLKIGQQLQSELREASADRSRIPARLYDRALRWETATQLWLDPQRGGGPHSALQRTATGVNNLLTHTTPFDPRRNDLR